jgi:hypothetical protein
VLAGGGGSSIHRQLSRRAERKAARIISNRAWSSRLLNSSRGAEADFTCAQITEDEGVKEALQGVQQGARKAPFPRVLDPHCHETQFLASALRPHFVQFQKRAR